MVQIFSDPRYKISKKLIKKGAAAIAAQKEIPEDYCINIVFVGKRKMKFIAQNYHKKAEALPVLSFSYQSNKKNLNQGGEEEKLIGEIFICYPQAVLLAAEREKPVNTTLLALIDHGINNIIS